MKLPERERKQTNFLEFEVRLGALLPREYGYGFHNAGGGKKSSTKKAKAGKKTVGSAAPKKAPAAKKATPALKKMPSKTAVGAAAPVGEESTRRMFEGYGMTREESRIAGNMYRVGMEKFEWLYWGAGKWNKYSPFAHDVVERQYAAWQVNPSVDVTAVDSGDWAYSVDFNAMEQRNIRHKDHRVRPVARIPKDGDMPAAPANADQYTYSPAKKSGGFGAKNIAAAPSGLGPRKQLAKRAPQPPAPRGFPKKAPVAPGKFGTPPFSAIKHPPSPPSFAAASKVKSPPAGGFGFGKLPPVGRRPAPPVPFGAKSTAAVPAAGFKFGKKNTENRTQKVASTTGGKRKEREEDVAPLQRKKSSAKFTRHVSGIDE